LRTAAFQIAVAFGPGRARWRSAVFVTVVLLIVIAALIAGAFIAECSLCRREKSAIDIESPTNHTA
jgi:hypothetical protein